MRGQEIPDVEAAVLRARIAFIMAKRPTALYLLRQVLLDLADDCLADVLALFPTEGL